MLLQPLVENIIIHAFEGVKSGGMITIQTKINTKNYLEIKIKDNGCGINPNTLKRIQNDIKNQVPLNSESIGISNVVNRLQLYYHGQAQIEILSEEQIGTEVNLVIPNTMIKED